MCKKEVPIWAHSAHNSYYELGGTQCRMILLNQQYAYRNASFPAVKDHFQRTFRRFISTSMVKRRHSKLHILPLRSPTYCVREYENILVAPTAFL